MAITPEETLFVVERNIFNYLNEKLEGTKVTGFQAELPRQVNATKGLKMWTFGMDGGNEVVPIQVKGATWCGWMMDGYIKAVFGEFDEEKQLKAREDAQRFAGSLLTHLPILSSDEVDGVTKCYKTTMPSFPRDTAIIKNDLAHGGEMRVWTFEISLVVVFGNVRN